MSNNPGWPLVPGETPIDDVSGLLDKNIGTRRQLNQAEAENITRAAAKYLVGELTEADAPFTFDWLFQLHREMFGNVWDWAGKPRTCDLNIGCPAYDVEAQVMNLVADLAYWGNEPTKLIDDAALLHYRAVKIHPFPNGNGRWARMLSNVWLRRRGANPISWPEPSSGEISPIRAEYIAALQAADANDPRPLVALHKRYATG
jgi:Fic-DOC domain mobile mystery protein B